MFDFRTGWVALAGKHGHSVRVCAKATAGFSDIIRADQVRALGVEFPGRLGSQLAGLGSEPYLHQGIPETRSDRRKDVRVRRQLNPQGTTGPLHLLIGDRCRTVVRNRRRHDQAIGPRTGRQGRVGHLQCRLHPDRGDPPRLSQRNGSGHKRHVGTRVPGRLGEGVPHLATRPVPDEPHRIERLVRASGCDHDASSRQSAITA